MQIRVQIPLYQTVTAALAAALIAGAAVGFPGLPHATGTSQISADQVTATRPLPAAAPLAGDPAAARGWPYSQPAAHIRLVTTDRLP
jgi:hypothetical protein